MEGIRKRENLIINNNKYNPAKIEKILRKYPKCIVIYAGNSLSTCVISLYILLYIENFSI